MRHNLFVSTITALLTIAASLAPQDARKKFAEAQKANAAMQRQYTWKSRTELKLKGESKNIKLEQVRYDLDGNQQKTPIGDTPQQQTEQSGGRRGGRLKQKVVEKKKEEFSEMMQGLGALVLSYSQLPPDKLQAFAQNASYSMGQGQEAGTIQIAGANVIQPGDSMTIWVDKPTMLFRRVAITTSYDQKPARVVCDYQTVTGGPNYMVRAVLDYPEGGVQVIVENFEYQRAG